MATSLLQRPSSSSAEEAAPAPAPPPGNPEPAAAPAPPPDNPESAPEPELQGDASPRGTPEEPARPAPLGRDLQKLCGRHAGWAFAIIAAVALVFISVMPELLLGDGGHSGSASVSTDQGKKTARGSFSSSAHHAATRLAKAREQGRFECKGGSPEAWPQAEQKWCCDHAPELQLKNQTQLWCRTHHADDQQPRGFASNSSARFNCTEELWTWKESWEPEKKRWCCQEQLMFCPPSALWTAPTTTATTTRTTATTTSTAATSATTRATTTAAPTTTTTTAAPTTTTAAPTTTTAAPTTTTATHTTAAPTVFAPSRTQAGSANPAAQPGAASPLPAPGSVVGAPSTFSAGMYDCGEYDSTWERDWTAAKKSWCCRHANRGCQPCEFGCELRGARNTCQAHIQQTADLLGGCRAAHAQVVQACSACGQCQVHAACGESESAGQDSVLTQSVDVGGATVGDVEQGEGTLVQGIANALHLQTADVHVAKLSDNQGSTRVMYQATVPRSQLQEVQKRASNLFYTASPGGGVQGSFASFDCQEGLLTWQTQWSERQKAYCCQNHGVGCSSQGAGQAPGTTSRRQYACDAVQELVWSEDERNWCCNVRPGGCQAPTTAAPFDCLNGMAAPSSWPEVKKVWCCQHYVVGCAQVQPPAAAPAPPRFTEASARLAPGTFLGPATRLRVRSMLALAGAALGTALLVLVLVLLGLRATRPRRDQRRLLPCDGDEHRLLEAREEMLL